MTQEEKTKMCSICKNRKFSTKEGLICGNTEAKPTFLDNCQDFDIDIVAQERLKKKAAELEKMIDLNSTSTKIFIGFIAFIAFLGITFLVGFIRGFQAVAPLSLAEILIYTLIWVGICGYFCGYLAFAYIRKMSDTIFVAKYLSVIGAIFGLFMFVIYPGYWLRAVIIIGICVSFFLYLIYSEEIDNRIPKESRKLTKLNKVMLIVSIVTQLFFYFSFI